MAERHVRVDSQGRLWERVPALGPDCGVHPELGGSEVYWREVDTISADLGRELYEALRGMCKRYGYRKGAATAALARHEREVEQADAQAGGQEA